MTDRVQKTEQFLRAKLAESPFFKERPDMWAYRLEHTYRVARIGASIARAEGFDQEAAVIACLLHDVSYCGDFLDENAWRDHGRTSARIARPFLEELGLPEETVRDICYGIAIHVDGKADFPGEGTPLALTVGDADNLDRFDVYRLYETLESVGFSRMSLAEKRACAEETRALMERYLDFDRATPTATALWRQRIGFYLDFYRRLTDQLAASTWGEQETAPTPVTRWETAARLGLAGSFPAEDREKDK